MTAKQMLEDALQAVLEQWRPHPQEYEDGGASYRAAKAVYDNALRVLSQHGGARKGNCGMKPTVGRIVHYYTRVPAEQSPPRWQGPYAALIVEVVTDYCVTLQVFSPMMGPFTARDVLESAADDPNVAEYMRRWTWPPRVE